MTDASRRQVDSSSLLTKTHNPTGLLRLFATLSVVSVVAILILAGSGIFRVFSQEMTRVAEQWAVYVGNTIFEQDRDLFLKGMSGAPIKDDFEQLDTRMKKFLTTFEMYKIKAFSIDKAIIYSTDHKIIGKVEGENHKLDKVLAEGVVISELEHKEKIRDLKGEERFGVDVIECYVPVRADGRIVGAFEVYVEITSTQARIISAAKEATLVLAIVLVTVFGLLYLPMRKGTLQLKESQEKLAELASVDGLTGIFNRRFLLNRVHEERERMVRAPAEATPGRMSFVMIDIDYFKKVNDNYGHQAGDAVLRDVSRRLKDCLRNYDVFGRYGGEEFLAMLPNTSMAEALFVADRLLESISNEPVMCDGKLLPITVSIGVSETLSPQEDAAHAINRADQSLYRAKETGRNRVCFADRPESVPSAEEFNIKPRIKLVMSDTA